MFSDETYRAVIVAAIHAKGVSGDIGETIKEVVGALQRADQGLTESKTEA